MKINKTVTRPIGQATTGYTVIIGKREYIVLEKGNGTVGLITKEPTKIMPFGKSSDYAKSDVRAYCNGEFYEELCREVGPYYVIPHTVDCTAYDRSTNGPYLHDNVSILTFNRCGYFVDVQLLPNMRVPPFWTATRYTATNKNKDYLDAVCTFGGAPRGRLLSYEGAIGVRPYFVLKASTPVLVPING